MPSQQTVLLQSGLTVLPDSLIYIDGKAPLAAMQRCVVIGESEGGAYSDRITFNPQWVDTPQEQGILRVSDPPGGLKFGRTKLAPASEEFPALVFSTHYSDTGSRARSEIAWREPILPYGEDLWIAARLWFDFDLENDKKQHITVMQIMHGAYGAVLNPMLGVSFYGGRRINVAIRYCDTKGMVQSDQTLENFYVEDAPASQWFDLVLKCRLHWKESANPYVRVWVNGDRSVTYAGRCGYRGPAMNGAPIRPEMRFGAYPGLVDSWEPNRVRNIYFRKALVCRNGGAYTHRQVRETLGV